MTAPAQLPKLNRAEKAGIITGITVTASAALGFGYTAPLIAQNLERMTQSGALLGWLISIAAITTILVTPIVPKLLSRFPARLVLIIALLIGTLTTPLFKAFWHVEAWFVIRFIAGLAFTIVFVTCETWINQLAPEHLRGRILGLYGTTLAGCFGLGAGLAVFTGIDGWFPFLFGAGLNLLGLIPLLFLLSAVNLVPPPRESAGLGAVFKIILAAPAILACGVVFGAIEQVVFHFLPVYGTRLGHSEHMGRVLLLIATLGNALFQFPMGMLADRVNRQKLLTAIMGFALIGPILMIFAGQNFTALAVLAFFYIGICTALYTVGLVLLAQRFKGHAMAAANAAFIFAYGVGSLLIPPLAGRMMDVYRPYGFMCVLAALGAIGLCLVLIGQYKRRSTSMPG